MSTTKLFAGIGCLALAVSAGLALGHRSWNGVIYLADGTLESPNSRTPAAIRHELDFSHLNGADLISATQKRLVTAARVIIKEGVVGVELGHFVTRDDTGQRRLACDLFYNRLTLQFEGNGVATDGDKPEMEIDAPCAPSIDDISSIEPVWIPVTKILKTRAENQDIEYADDVKFHFTGLEGSWPVSWTLSSVRLYNTDNSTRAVSISAQELHDLRAHPFVVKWLDAKRLPTSTKR